VAYRHPSPPEPAPIYRGEGPGMRPHPAVDACSSSTTAVRHPANKAWAETSPGGKRGLTPASPLGEEPKPVADFIMFKIKNNE